MKVPSYSIGFLRQKWQNYTDQNRDSYLEKNLEVQI